MLLFSFYCDVLAQPQKPSGFVPYKIDSTLNSTFANAKSKSEFNLPMLDDAYWFFLDKENFKDFIGEADPLIYFDTLQTYMEGICDCMMRNDTVYLQGGIAYIGGLGFNIKIVKNLFEGKIWLAGKGYRTIKSSKFEEEIILNSVKQVLKINSKDSLKLNSKVIGEILLESEEFYEKDKDRPNKYYMKLLFGCRLDEIIVF